MKILIGRGNGGWEESLQRAHRKQRVGAAATGQARESG